MNVLNTKSKRMQVFLVAQAVLLPISFLINKDLASILTIASYINMIIIMNDKLEEQQTMLMLQGIVVRELAKEKGATKKKKTAKKEKQQVEKGN